MPLLTKQIGFSAAHFYWREDWTDEANQKIFHACANRHGHGHNYLVEVSLEGQPDEATGMIINFFELDPILQQAIIDPLDHKNLNLEIPFFQTHIPTLENIARFIRQQLHPWMIQRQLLLANVKVIEHANLYAELNGANNPMLTLTRRYPFSAAHRLWNDTFSEMENRRHFGACVNIHGHNYALEVTLQGEPSPETGMIMDLVALDELVHTIIVSKVDHTYLDQDVDFLAGQLSTVENVAQRFFEILRPRIPDPAKLYRIRLYESETNWTDVLGKEVT